MRSVLSNWKPLVLLIVSKLTMIVLIVSSMLIAIGSIKSGQTTLSDFYQHPFQVTRAASTLASSTADIRSHMLQMALEHKLNKTREHMDAITLRSEEIHQAIATIRQQFLGDMARVEQLRKDLAIWSRLREQILHRMSQRDYEGAANLAKSQGDEIFRRVQTNVDYISNFAQNEAKEYARNAREEAHAAITNLYGLMTVLTTFLLVWTTYLISYFFRNSQSLEKDAQTDPLTGLLRRSQFLLLAEQVMKASRRHDTPFSLLMVDIDDFKHINDTYGHSAGDFVIQTLAITLKEMLRESDLIARWGGEEFLILMPEINESEALVAANRIRETCAQKVVHTNGKEVRFALSGGIRESTGNILFDISLEEADQCLYLAKETGKNRIVPYSETHLASGKRALS